MIRVVSGHPPVPSSIIYPGPAHYRMEKMRPLYPALAVIVTLLAFLYLTAQYFPGGVGKTIWQPHPLPPPDPKEPVKTSYTKGDITGRCEQAFR